MPAIHSFVPFLIDEIDKDNSVVYHHSRQCHHRYQGVQRKGQPGDQQTEYHTDKGKGYAQHHNNGLHITAELTCQDGIDEQ